MITRLGTYSQIKGGSYKIPCVVATTVAITLSGTQTIDGVAVVAGNRVLVKNQADATTNGIYVVSASTWARAVDMSLTDDLYTGVQILINSGSTYTNKIFVLTTANPITLGTTGLTFTLSIYGTGTVTSVSALTLGTTGTDLSSTVANSTTTPVITLNVPTASASNRGVLSSTDWTTFNTKQSAISLTTTGASGASTFSSNTLNVPAYTLSGLGGQPLATNLTSLAGLSYASTSFVKMTAAGTFGLDTSVYYLASNPNGWTSNTGTVTSVATSAPLTGGTITTTGTIGITQATTSANGYLSSTDWNTFNNKVSTTGSGATGTWGINITGNAATITSQANSATITATSANTASQIVQRDGSGNFAAGTITANYMYFGSGGRGLQSPDAAGATYGQIFTYGTGRNSYNGYGTTDGTYSYYFMWTAGYGGGIYQTRNGWMFLYEFSNNSVVINGSSTVANMSLSVPYDFQCRTLYQTSDIRTKKNINNLNEALSKIKKIRPVSYEFIDHGSDERKDNGAEFGVIAQELIEIIPNLVVHDKQSDRYSVSSTGLIALLLQGMKEQQEQIENLTNKIK